MPQLPGADCPAIFHQKSSLPGPDFGLRQFASAKPTINFSYRDQKFPALLKDN
jgi:hypothetical protein